MQYEFRRMMNGHVAGERLGFFGSLNGAAKHCADAFEYFQIDLRDQERIERGYFQFRYSCTGRSFY